MEFVGALLPTTEATSRAGGADGKVTIWRADEGLANAVVIDIGEGAARHVKAEFRDGGSEIVTILDQGRAIVWDVSPDALIERACDIARRDLSQEEWDAVVPNRPYQETCPSAT